MGFISLLAVHVTRTYKWYVHKLNVYISWWQFPGRRNVEGEKL